MREQEKGRRQSEIVDSLIRGFSWDRLSAIDWRNELSPISYLYYYDRRSGRRATFITSKEFARHITITVISIGLFGAGLASLIGELFK